MKRTVLTTALVLLVTVLLSCGGLSEYSGEVTIHVDTNGTPTFYWSPECKVYCLGVETTGWDIGDVWVVESECGFGPGVKYGEVPDGAREVTEPYHNYLLPGGEYVVFLYNDPEYLTDPYSQEYQFLEFRP